MSHTHGSSATSKRRLANVVQTCLPTTPPQVSVVHPGVAGGIPLSYTPVFSKHRASDVVEKFLQLKPDQASEAFLREYCMGGESVFTDAMAHVLKWMQWSRTDINATLGRGQMYVISHANVRSLLTASGCAVDWTARSILDVGAGDGNVTSTALEPLLQPSSTPTSTSTGVSSPAPCIVTTEVSGPMAQCLRKRGYVCIETTDLHLVKEQLNRHATPPTPTPSSSATSTSSPQLSPTTTNGTYDFISIFNVLDRADKPQSLLYDVKRLLTPSVGRCIISVVLPFCPFVEIGQRQQKPKEDLNMDGGRCLENASYERAVDVLIKNVFEPSGFKVHAWSKTPYICSGDRTTPYYVLYDAVFVLSVK